MKRCLALLLLMVIVVTLPACGARRRAFQGTATAVAATALAQAQPQAAAPVAIDAPVAGGNVLFQDNFQDGQADGWSVNGGWTVQQAGVTYVLDSAVPGSAWVPQGAGWTDYAFQVGVQMNAGGLALSFRVGQAGRYVLHMRPEAMYLTKEQPLGTYQQLTQTTAPAFGTWHTVVVAGSGGHLQVYVDGALQLDYTDPSPLPAGTVGVSTLEGYQASVDDVLVTALAGPLPVAVALPPTVPALGVDLPLGDIPVPQGTAVVEEGSEPEMVETEPAVEDGAELDQAPSGGEGEEPPPDGGVLPVIDYLTYEPAEEEGCYYLTWDLHDATAAYLNGEGVVAPGSTEVCHPDPGTYVYTLRAESAAGGVEQAVSIVVGLEDDTGAPDLVVAADVWVPAPANPRVVAVAIEVNNVGQAGAGPFTVRWYPHGTSDEVGCSIDVTGLPAQSAVALNPCSYTYAARGEMHWRVVADADDDVPGEMDEGNNLASGTVSVDMGGGEEDDVSVPAAPSGLVSSGWTMNTWKLTWTDNSDNEDGFRVRHVDVGVEAETGPNVAEAEVPKPSCGEPHEYRVRAFNDAGDSEPSETLVIEYDCP